MSSYRWRAGTHAAVDVTTVYDVTAFPIQSDQPSALSWYEPQGDRDIVTYAEIVRGWEKSLRLGGLEFNWTIGPLTLGMLSYIETTIFNGGDEEADVTVMTEAPTLGLDWAVIQCRVLWPGREQIVRQVGHLPLYVFRFIDGTVV